MTTPPNHNTADQSGADERVNPRYFIDKNGGFQSDRDGIQKDAHDSWVNKNSWGLSRDDFIRLSYFHGCMEQGSDGSPSERWPINGSNWSPDDVVYKSESGRVLTRSMVSHWLDDCGSYMHGYISAMKGVATPQTAPAIVLQVVQAPSNGAVKTATKVFQSIFFNAGLDGESAYEQMQRAMRAAIISSEYVADPIVATGDLSTTVPSEPVAWMWEYFGTHVTTSVALANDLRQSDDITLLPLYAAPSPTEQASDVRNADCYSHNDGDSWCDCPDDIVFVHGLKVGDEYEVLASTRAWTERYRVTKAPDDTSDDYEVELVSAPAAKGNAQDEAKS